MNPNVYRLLDNGWIVSVMRSVDLKYTAYCRRKFTKGDDVFATIEFHEDAVTGEVSSKQTAPGKPRQRASADTYEEAIELLATQMHATEEPII